MDASYHYPPELMSLLIDTIPLLCPSKDDTLLFLTGAGADDATTSDLAKRVQFNRDKINKYEIVRTVLRRLNEGGDSALRARREIVKRVVEFDDFSSCWEKDRLKAQGLVSQIQKLVGVKDSFTRMAEERERESWEHKEQHQAALDRIRQQQEIMERLKAELFALFGETNPQRRGKKLEDVLNRLFKAAGISIRQAFTLQGQEGEGIVEQVDGVIELGNHLHFVEMKWWREPVDVPQISAHMVRVFLRSESRAIIISASDFTGPAIAVSREALSHKVVTLCTLQEIVGVLDSRGELADFLKRKVDATIIQKHPFPQVPFHP